MGANHNHGGGAALTNERATAFVACLTGGFMVVEFIGGWLANSLTLMADAAHMATDTVALLMAWWAFTQARKPETSVYSFGQRRLPVLVAFANALFLLVVSAYILMEAVGKFRNPEPVAGETVIVIGALGLAVNVAALLILMRGDRQNLNIKSALLHVLSDLLGSVAAVIAGVVVLTTGWMPIDAVLSAVVALLLVRTTVQIMRDAGRILLEAAPEGLSTEAVAQDLTTHVADVDKVYHVHIWSIAQGEVLASLHAVVADEDAHGRATAALRARLNAAFGINHATIEIDHPHADADPDAPPPPGLSPPQ